MRAPFIAAALIIGCLCLGCAGGGDLSARIAKDDPRHVLFDGGGFLFRSKLAVNRDTTLFYSEDIVVGEPDGPTVTVGGNPFSSTPYRVFVFEPDSVSLRVFSLQGDTIGDYGTYYLDRGLYRLYFECPGEESGIYWAEIGHDGILEKRKWVHLK
jgi:hypothetical protein